MLLGSTRKRVIGRKKLLAIHVSLRIQSVSLFCVAKLRKEKCLVPAKPSYTIASVWRCPGVFVFGFPWIVVDV
jgi:hypothetical protein